MRDSFVIKQEVEEDSHEVFTDEEVVGMKLEVEEIKTENPEPTQIFEPEVEVKTNLNNHAEAENQYECDICFKTFRKLPHLKYHRRSHKRIQCDICMKNISSLNVKRHRSTHDNKKVFECKKCKKGFSTSTYLAKHVTCHNDEQLPFQCAICERKFAFPAQLRTHRWTVHAEVKSYSCYLCHQRFPTPSALEKHLKTTHATEPYQCGVCWKGFDHPEQLGEHMRTHFIYECQVCKKLFSGMETRTICVRSRWYFV